MAVYDLEILYFKDISEYWFKTKLHTEVLVLKLLKVESFVLDSQLLLLTDVTNYLIATDVSMSAKFNFAPLCLSHWDIHNEVS